MITGKDIIIYILEYDLVNEILLTESCISDILLTTEQVAVKFGVGVAVVETLYKLGMLKGFNIGGQVYFPMDIKYPKGDADVNEK